jgi:hypothetical protein
LEITYEKTVSAEDRAKALALMLPPNFYSYRNAPPCPGCVGCEPNEVSKLNLNSQWMCDLQCFSMNEEILIYELDNYVFE